MTEKPAGAVNRARAAGLRIFCSRRCAGLGRRKHKTKAQKVEEKRIYDADYRRKNLARIKTNKAAYFRRTYDPVAARIKRKKRAKAHAEYCRRPEYRKWKSEYDKKRTDKKYGPFAECNRLMMDLNHEIKRRVTNEQIRIANGTWSKPQQRRRADKAPERSRPRFRDRRDRHPPAVGQ